MVDHQPVSSPAPSPSKECMMTRDDFLAAVETLGSAVDIARYLEQMDEIFAHDAEQRAEIERLTHTIRELLARFGEQNYPEVQAAQQVMKEHP